jgi:hypothetical protein
MALWEDHLLAPLTCKDAGQLACTCQALRVVVREHFKDLGRIKLKKLQAALTTFPKARLVALQPDYSGTWAAPEREPLVEWLRAGGHGRYLTRYVAEDASLLYQFPVFEALRGGAFPSLRSVAATLKREPHRVAILMEGLVTAMHEVRLEVSPSQEWEHKLAALGLVRQLPFLNKLDLKVRNYGGIPIEGPVQWPPFMPSSLKTLSINVGLCGASLSQSLLSALPGMLGASAARLDRLEVLIPTVQGGLGDGLVHVAKSLRYCSQSLKGLHLDTCLIGVSGEREDYTAKSARLRVEWADVLAGVSACRELRVLVLPPYIDAEPVFPKGTAFGHLAHLDICDYKRERPSGEDVMGLWELMASGRLPALATLRVTLRTQEGVEDVRTQVAPALAAVAGTLTHLYIREGAEDFWRSIEVGMAYELGKAVGKLRRLKDLVLQLSQDGRAYKAVAQGLAASGEDRPLPLLWQVGVGRVIQANADLLASLLLPSIRVLVTCTGNNQETLLLACALRQRGYKHVWAFQCEPENVKPAARAITQCRFSVVESHNSLWEVHGLE